MVIQSALHKRNEYNNANNHISREFKCLNDLKSDFWFIKTVKNLKYNATVLHFRLKNIVHYRLVAY